MRTIAVLCFTPSERPAYMAEWLGENDRPWKLYQLHAGEPFPTSARELAGIAMMGGTISANDPAPWKGPLFALLSDAFARQVPVIGHCLGGQIMAHALGAQVKEGEPEIGWHDVHLFDEAAVEWFGPHRRFTPFHWHYEQFELPANARRVLTNAVNINQAFVFDNRHIGLQCHIEVDLPQLETWCRLYGDLLPERADRFRQPGHAILETARDRVAALRPIARLVYSRWSQGLRF